MPNVFIINKSSHDFSPAEKFGKLIYLSEGPLNRFDTNNMIRIFKPILEKNANSDDYILLTSLTTMCVIVASIFSDMFGSLNLLIWKDGRYVERRHIL